MLPDRTTHHFDIFRLLFEITHGSHHCDRYCCSDRHLRDVNTVQPVPVKVLGCRGKLIFCHRHRPTAVVGHQPINISLIPILRCEVTNVQRSLIRHPCCRGSPTCCAKSDERFLCVGTTKSTISNQLSLSRWLVSIRRRAEIGSENVQRTIPGNCSNCEAGRQPAIPDHRPAMSNRNPATAGAVRLSAG